MLARRKVYLDLLRIIAIVLVVANHSEGFYLYQYTKGLKKIFFILYDLLVKINVPLFFMISGTLLLGRVETLRNIFIKRIGRFIITLILFEILLYILNGYLNNTAISFGDVIRRISSNTINEGYSYWYLYAYLSFLVMLPFMRKVVVDIKKQEIAILIILRVLIRSIVPLVNFFFLTTGQEPIVISNFFSPWLVVSDALFYPIIGYYIDGVLNLNGFNRKSINVLSIVCLCTIIINIVVVYVEGMVLNQYSGNYFTLFDFELSIFVFCVVKKIMTKCTDCFGRMGGQFISNLGKLTFGVYLLEPFIRILIKPRFEVAVYNKCSSTFMYSNCWCIFCVVIGFVVSFILRKLPIFRKLL